MLRIAFLIISTLLTSCSLLPTASYVDKTSTDLRVVTYNVNWMNGDWKHHKPLKTIATIKHIRADIVLLQETTPRWQRLVNKHLAATYRYRYFKHYENAGGLAVLSKYPVHSLAFEPHKHGWHPFWIVKIDTPRGPIQIVNLHLNPRIDKDQNVGFFGYHTFATAHIRLRETKEILEAINPRYPTLIAGDFNDGDDTHPIKYLKKNGYLDAIDHFDGPTWHWHCGPLLLTNRFDRVFYDRHFKLKRAQVLHAGSSDHFPVIVDFHY